MAASNAPASKSGLYADPREDWLAQRKEEILDSSRPIVDPHHHLWDRGGQRYMIEEMAADIASVDVPRRRTGSVPPGRRS